MQKTRKTSVVCALIMALMGVRMAGCAKPMDASNSSGDSTATTGLAQTANTTPATPTSATTDHPSTPGAPVATPNSVVTPPAGSANPNTPVSNVKAAPWPNVGFVNNPGLPGLNDVKAVALTFDDGPDGSGPVPWGKASPSNMSHMLDQLDSLGLKATFFLCGKLWADALNDPQAQADIQRMVASGHHFGSHTLNHNFLTANTPRNTAAGKPSMTLAQVQYEFSQNEAVFSDPRLLGPGRMPFTMYRAPYGNPFQDGIVYPPDANSIVDDVTGIAPASPYNAVHVGWGIDTDDWNCAQSYSDSNCILNNLNAFLDKGASGPILMHTVYKLSGDTLPQVVASIKSHGYHIVMVEDFIKGKYGASSKDLYQANLNANFKIDDVNKAAVAAAKESKWYLQTNEH